MIRESEVERRARVTWERWTCALVCVLVTATHASAAGRAEVPRGKLPRTVVPLHYTLTLTIDPHAKSFEGESTVRIKVQDPVASFWMHGALLEIQEATLTPAGETKAIALSHWGDAASGALELRAAQPLVVGEADVHFRWRAKFDPSLLGAYRMEQDKESYVITQMEPLGARRVMPCFDEPAFKTPWDVTLIVPEADHAIANGKTLGEDPLPGGRKRVRFATTAALPTYLIAFVVGPYDVVEWQPIPPTPQRSTPLPLRGIAVKRRGKDLTYALENTAAIITAEEAYFGMAYPFEKLDLIAAPEFGYGAMENAGLIAYQDNLLLITDQTPTGLKQAFWGTHAHELSHQWFGNLVTMPWWDDIWLNESFATWIAGKIVGQLKPEFHPERYEMRSTLYAMYSDRLATTRRIHEPIDDYTDISSAFDSISYAKGGAVLTMFEAYVGEDRFRDAIRAHLRRFAGGSATSADLMRSIAAVSDEPEAVVKAFQSFTDQPGAPLVDVEVSCADGAAKLSVSQRRSLPLGSTGKVDQVWGVPFCVRYGSTDSNERACALVDKPSLSPAMTLDSCPAWVMPNVNGAGYYRFALDGASREALEKHFEALDPREQLSYAGSLEAAFAAGTLTPSAFLSAVPRLATGGSWEVVTAPFDRLEWMREFLARSPVEKAAFEAWLSRTYRSTLERVGLDDREGEPDDQRLLRERLVEFLSRIARDAPLRQELLARARRMVGDGSDGAWKPESLSPNQWGAALQVYAQEGGAAELEILIKRLPKVDDTSLRESILTAIGSVEKPALAARARDLALDPKVRSDEVSSILWPHLERPANRADGKRWIRAHREALLARLPSPWKGEVADLYAVGACSESEARDMSELFERRLKDEEGGPRTIDQVREMIQLCGALRERQLAAGFGTALGATAPSNAAR